MQTTKKKMSTETLVLGGVLTALVFALQLVAVLLKSFNLFTISLVLIPIVIGTALCGMKMGAWLGLVFGIAVLVSGDAAAFLGVNVFGTIITVLLKGIGCGLCAGLVYKSVMKLSNRQYLAVLMAAIVCPIVNTGIFVLGCFAFFLPTITEWAQQLGYANVWQCIVLYLIGFNFLLELGSNIVLSPIILRILKIRKK